MATSYQCPACGSFQPGVLNNPMRVICNNCGASIVDNSKTNPALTPAPMPEDWTFIKIGSTATINDEQCAVVGRVRLQLLNEYKNIWTLVSISAKTYQLIESFGSFSIFGPQWHIFDKDPSKLRSGKTVPISSASKFHGEYLEKCIEIHCEGEIAIWHFFKPGFFIFQCTDPEMKIAFMPFEPKEKIQYLLGAKLNLENLKLSNIVSWDEWK
jgi:hypothetical protein